MANFDARTASNSPEVTDPEAVRAVIARCNATAQRTAPTTLAMSYRTIW